MILMCRGEVWIGNGGVVLCPACLGHDIVKGGFFRGKQRFECRGDGCGRVFVERDPRQLVDEIQRAAIREIAVNLVLAGVVNVAGIANATGVSVRTIYHDLEQARG